MQSKRAGWLVEPADATKPLQMLRVGRGIRNMDRDFDIAFWQALDTSTRMRAAWELVEHYLKQKDRMGELRLQRSVTVLKRGRR